MLKCDTSFDVFSCFIWRLRLLGLRSLTGLQLFFLQESLQFSFASSKLAWRFIGSFSRFWLSFLRLSMVMGFLITKIAWNIHPGFSIAAIYVVGCCMSSFPKLHELVSHRFENFILELAESMFRIRHIHFESITIWTWIQSLRFGYNVRRSSL